MTTQTKFFALLRGINIGKHKKIKMADLREALVGVGFTDVKTILATGNVIFQSNETDTAILKQQFETLIMEQFGHEVNVIVHPFARIQALVASNPFEGVTVTKDTRLYVTFLSAPPPTDFTLPYQSDDGRYEILAVDDWVVCSVLTLTPTVRTTDAMNILEKTFGKDITTRNWNTVEKISNL